MIDINKPQDELIQDVKQGIKKSSNFFQFQSRDTLQAIIQMTELKAIYEDDEKKKKELLKIAELSQKQIQYSQNKEKQRKDAITYHLNFRQGAKEISLTQTILMLLTTLTVCLISYYNNNQRQNWFTITIGAGIITLLVSFLGVVIYNCCCHKRIQKDTINEIQEQAKTWLNTPQRKKQSKDKSIQEYVSLKFFQQQLKKNNLKIKAEGAVRPRSFRKQFCFHHTAFFLS